MASTALVGMSGGVDSAAAALLLRREGFRVVGVTMLLHDAADASDAEAVCRHLGIRHEVVDLRAEFSREVVGSFLDEYAAGRTPNPCLLCNDRFKFGRLLEFAARLGGDVVVATGHYARLQRGADGLFRILRGVDRAKDQSYALFMLDQARLRRIAFPLGGLTKAEVRSLARKAGLPAFRRPESQEVCFVPGGDYRAFFARMRPEACRPGRIVDTSGRVLGRHDGIHAFTIGQRRGLGIALGRPMYVVGIDPRSGTVTVASAPDAMGSSLVAERVSFVSGEAPRGPFRCLAQIRYSHEAAPAVARVDAHGRLHVAFDRAQKAVTPGQAVVLYDGDVVLGGGYISGWTPPARVSTLPR